VYIDFVASTEAVQNSAQSLGFYWSFVVGTAKLEKLSTLPHHGSLGSSTYVLVVEIDPQNDRFHQQC
jgi:hypothetical protein